MPHTRRFIKSNTVYEISFRARDCLPFACTGYMKLLIYSALARVQRDNKVLLHHFIFEGSHPHIICTAKDAYQCQEFYGQLKKQLTDSCKRLLGLKHLQLWEDRAAVIEIPTLEDAIDKIGYLYSNPSNDDLASSIDRYPGVSSWKDFQTAENADTCIRSDHPWIQLPMIPKLPSLSVTPKQDKFLCRQMSSKAKQSHTLEVYPLQWIQRFIPNLTPKVTARVTREVLENLAAREAANSRRRQLTGKKPMGATKLRSQPAFKPHKSKKQGRKIHVQSRVREIRLAMIKELQAVSDRCRQVYKRWKAGDFSVPWPAGTFPPPLPPLANYFCY